MDNMFELMMLENQKHELQTVLECNTKTARFGLALSEEEATELTVVKKQTLKDERRVEFGSSILPELIYAFCDSQYITQDSYVATIAELQEIFYMFKNESMDDLTDSELLEFMKKQFEEICFGDLDYLKTTCLERYTRAIRSGYQTLSQQRLHDEYFTADRDNEYSKFSEETRWEYELYMTSLEDTY